MIILYIILFVYLALSFGLFGYAGAMAVKRNFKTLNIKQKILLFLPLAVFVFITDILVLNFIIGTFYFRKTPRLFTRNLKAEWTLSTRLDNYAKGNDWEAQHANEFCKALLNNIDPSGHHCGKRTI